MAQKKGMANVNEQNDCIEFLNHNETDSITVHSYHISCKSDIFDGSDMLGIVLYSYNGKTQWQLNGIRCKSGYIYLCKSKHLQNIHSSSYDSMHARCYKRLFGEDPNYMKIVGAGFGYKDKDKNHKEKGKEWRYNSSTFNAPLMMELGRNNIPFKDEYHDKQRRMHKKEEKWVFTTINEWILSGFTRSTIYVQSAIWSWWRGKWIDYDIDTNKYIENQYEKYNAEQNSTKNKAYCIDLKTAIFAEGNKLYNQYRIYFSAPNISLNPQSMQSRDHPKWKNDTDERNQYYLQENHRTRKYRIVRRRYLIND